MEKAQISKRQAQKWANALRSGEYKQGLYSLHNSNGYCCLGVACDLFIPKGKQRVHDGRLLGDLPEHQPWAPKWLKHINKDLHNKLDLSFSELNDVREYSFNEIADIIELVYVHRALDEG